MVEEEKKQNNQEPEKTQKEKVEKHLKEEEQTEATHAEETKQDTPEKSSEVKTVKLDELTEESEYSPEEMEKFAQIYDSTISKFAEGEIVTGRILAIDAKEVSVDVGFKSEGVVPIEEFSNIKDLKVGDEIEVYIDTVEDKDGQLVLSYKKAEFMRAWDKVVELAEKDEIIKGRITRRIKGGMVVDLMGVEAFLPGSQIDIRPIRDFDALIGQEFDFKIVNVNHMRKNIVVSRRVLIEEEMKDQREKILRDLEKGQVLEGIVKNITDFGVFIDLGGVDGLLHINDLSWGRIGHPSEVVSLDQKIKVQVLDFDPQKTRISLGYKQLQPHPWENVDETYPVGKKVSGKVVNITDYGAFVELEKGIEGLIHISEMSWTQHIKHPSQILNLGDIVEAVVLNVDKEEHKISLGLKQLQPDPWEKIEENYPVGSRQKGIVRNLTNFGAFVELEEGVDGLVHISDLSWTRKVRHPSEVIKRNQEIEVEVLAIDKENRRISLGYKQIFENPWDKLEEEYKLLTEVKGKVTRCIEKGVIVEIPEAVEGFVPASHLKKMEKPGFKRTSEAYKVGEELELVVIEFDKTNKRIVLSERSPEELKDLPALKEEEKSYEEEVSGAPETEKGKATKAKRTSRKAKAVAEEKKQDSTEAGEGTPEKTDAQEPSTPSGSQPEEKKAADEPVPEEKDTKVAESEGAKDKQEQGPEEQEDSAASEEESKK